MFLYNEYREHTNNPIFYSMYNVKLKPGESSEKKNVPHS